MTISKTTRKKSDEGFEVINVDNKTMTNKVIGDTAATGCDTTYTI